jgi:hypothetical protein
MPEIRRGKLLAEYKLEIEPLVPETLQFTPASFGRRFYACITKKLIVSGTSTKSSDYVLDLRHFKDNIAGRNITLSEL